MDHPTSAQCSRLWSWTLTHRENLKNSRTSKETNNSPFQTPWPLNHQVARNRSQWIAFLCSISQHLAQPKWATSMTTGFYLKVKQTLQSWVPTNKVPRTALERQEQRGRSSSGASSDGH